MTLSSDINRTKLLAHLREFGKGNTDDRLLIWKSSWEDSKGKGVRIALLDGGYKWNHPVFSGIDIIAKDLTGGGSLADSTGHGSQMLSLLVGRFGLVPDAKIFLGKVLKSSSVSNVERYITHGIYWAIKQQVDILALPLGRTRPSRLIEAAVQSAAKDGIQVFAAAGNLGPSQLLFPASLPGIRSVTGADMSGTILAECSQGVGVDCIALGQVPSITAASGGALTQGSSPATVIAAATSALEMAAAISYSS
ncbi:MAG: S8 family serine peptidase [Verrucomicrobiota bacterium]